MCPVNRFDMSVTLNDLRASRYSGPGACARIQKFTDVMQASDIPLPKQPFVKRYHGPMSLGMLRAAAAPTQASAQASRQVPFRTDLLRMTRSGQLRPLGGMCKIGNFNGGPAASAPPMHRIVFPGMNDCVIKGPRMCPMECEPSPGSLPAPVICRQDSVCHRSKGRFARRSQGCCGGN